MRQRASPELNSVPSSFLLSVCRVYHIDWEAGNFVFMEQYFKTYHIFEEQLLFLHIVKLFSLEENKSDVKIVLLNYNDDSGAEYIGAVKS